MAALIVGVSLVAAPMALVGCVAPELSTTGGALDEGSDPVLHTVATVNLPVAGSAADAVEPQGLVVDCDHEACSLLLRARVAGVELPDYGYEQPYASYDTCRNIQIVTVLERPDGEVQRAQPATLRLCDSSHLVQVFRDRPAPPGVPSYVEDELGLIPGENRILFEIKNIDELRATLGEVTLEVSAMVKPGDIAYRPYCSCNGACVDTDNDPSHCGRCGTKCKSSEACILGECAEVICDPDDRTLCATGRQIRNDADDTVETISRGAGCAGNLCFVECESGSDCGWGGYCLYGSCVWSLEGACFQNEDVCAEGELPPLATLPVDDAGDDGEPAAPAGDDVDDYCSRGGLCPR